MNGALSYLDVFPALFVGASVLTAAVLAAVLVSLGLPADAVGTAVVVGTLGLASWLLVGGR